MFVRRANTRSEKDLIPQVIRRKFPKDIKAKDKLYGYHYNTAIVLEVWQDSDETWSINTEHGIINCFYENKLKVIEPVVGVEVLGLNT